MKLFKLSIKNISKSVRDYTIYFLTLVLGVAIFYVFNALESQTALKGLSESSYEIIELMVGILSYVSVLVAFILGFLIVYANGFLIKRRKKEFGVYMMLGMGKGGISRILFGETILIGIISLSVGLLLGTFSSQFMSVLVAKLFEADLTGYTFTVSVNAVKKTIIYFGIMYLIVLLFNAFSVTKYKLIDLFQASHKGEKETMKNSLMAVLVFFVSAGILAYAYYQVAFRASGITIQRAGIMILLGCIGTFLLFWSLSGFLLKLLQRFKRVYYKNLNAFNLRQLSTNMNTAVFSMTMICLLLFATICAFCSGMSMNNALNTTIKKMTPVDVNIVKRVYTPDYEGVTEEKAKYAPMTVSEMLEEAGVSMTNLKPDYVEVSTYQCETLTLKDSLGTYIKEAVEKFPMLEYEGKEHIISNSDYNKLAALYGNKTFELADDEYVIICDFNNMVMLRNLALASAPNIKVGDCVLKPAVTQCEDGYLIMTLSNMNTGVFIVPDAVVEKELNRSLTNEERILAGDYAANNQEEKVDMEALFTDSLKSVTAHIAIDFNSKMGIKESSTGLSVIVTFIVLYLGVVFLISGAAILALKALSEAADSVGRYAILQKLGTDEKLLHRALLSQLGLFFILPLSIAVIHSIFGMRFITYLLSVYNQKDLLNSVGITAALLLVIYGCYFLATYNGSRRMIDEK